MLSAMAKSPSLVTAKEEMLRRIRGLEATNFDLRELNEDLEEENQDLRGRNELYRLKDDRVEFIFNAFRSHADGEEILNRLKSGHSYDEIAQWLGGPPVPQISRLSPISDQKLAEVVRRFHEASDIDPRQGDRDIHRWTSVTSEGPLVRHLLALYFSWVHPAHMLFDEAMFMTNFDHGRATLCSPGLVNAICATACQLFDGNSDMTAKTLGDLFLEETLQHLNTESTNLLTTIQAFAVLFLCGWGAGEGAKASPYLRLAVESLNTVAAEGLPNGAVEISVWGIQTLNTAWAGLTYQKPFAPASPHAIVFRNIDLDRSDADWRDYRQPEDLGRKTGQPSFALRTAFERAKLYRIVHETINICCGSRGRITASSVLQVYRRFLEWEKELPPALANVGQGGGSAMPHVSLLHMEYSTAVINLFRPLIEYPEFSEPTHTDLRSLCLHAAQSGFERAGKTHALYGSRHQPPIHSLCLLHLSDLMLRLKPPQQNPFEIMHFCTASLQEASAGFTVCAIFLQMFRQAVHEYGLTPPQETEERGGPRKTFAPYDLLNACTRLTYAQPAEMIASRIDPAMGHDFAREWQQLIGDVHRDKPDRHGQGDSGGGSSSSSSGDLKYMQINALLNE
ncbi:MAG: hypothetical protein M1819_003194 [Sarea resinae]|nr:MAG: hypothetical protein M1819_003194 [Sarea resinae]